MKLELLVSLSLICASASGTPLSNGALSTADLMSARSRYVSGLSDADKEALRRKFYRFQSLKPAEQDRLRQLEEDLVKDPNGPELRRIMVRYEEWFATLPATSRADLSDRSPTDRISAVTKLLHQQESQRMGPLAGTNLKSSDVEAIQAWIEDFVTDNEQRLLAEIPEHVQLGFLNRIDDPHRRRLATYGAYLRHGKSDRTVRPSEKELKLSPEAQAVLREIKDPKKRAEVLQEWIKRVGFFKMTPTVSKEQLQKFFNERLDPQQRDYLENLPVDQMRTELTKAYFRDKWKRWGGHPGGGPPGSGPRAGGHRGDNATTPDRRPQL